MLAPTFIQAKEADPVIQTIEKALEEYKKDDFSNAASSLDYASQLIRQKKGEALGKLLPGPLDGWTADEGKAKVTAASLFGGGLTAEKNYMKDVRELFNTIPIHEAPLLPKEILGKDALLEFGKALYSDKDTAQIFFKGKPYEILKEGESYSMILKLPFVSKEEVKLHQVGDELTIHIENQRRNIFLPKFLAKLNVDKANLENGVLKVTFEKPKDSPKH